MEVRVQILGPLEVRVAGGLLAVRGTQARAVLALLALHVNEVVSTDSFIDGLWGAPPASAVNIVQVYVSRLRKALQAEQGAERSAAVLQRRGPGSLEIINGGSCGSADGRCSPAGASPVTRIDGPAGYSRVWVSMSA
jgi:Transcriptional regulatory protein, C terminal